MRMLCGLLLVSFSVAARADEPLVRREQVRLNLGGAEFALEAAKRKAVEMGLSVNIAVVDEGGHLLAFARQDGARPASLYTAISKAATAATLRAATGPVQRAGADPDPLLNLSLQNTAAMSGGKFTTLYGGVPIVIDDQVIGALGVGGAKGEQDAEIARAGAEALAARVAEKPE